MWRGRELTSLVNLCNPPPSLPPHCLKGTVKESFLHPAECWSPPCTWPRPLAWSWDNQATIRNPVLIKENSSLSSSLSLHLCLSLSLSNYSIESEWVRGDESMVALDCLGEEAKTGQGGKRVRNEKATGCRSQEGLVQGQAGQVGRGQGGKRGTDVSCRWGCHLNVPVAVGIVKHMEPRGLGENTLIELPCHMYICLTIGYEPTTTFIHLSKAWKFVLRQQKKKFFFLPGVLRSSTGRC